MIKFIRITCHRFLFIISLFFLSLSISSFFIPPKKFIEEKPFLIWSTKKQPKRNYNKPVIFYAPHQDDETLAMGASIAEEIRKGKTVFVVLFTNGKNEGIRSLLNGKIKCNFHNTYHDFNLSNEDVISARNTEFIEACRALGVHQVYIANNGKGFDESIGLKKMNEKFYETMLYFDDLYPEASHKTISGNCDTYDDEGHTMEAHSACANALQNLYTNGKIDEINLYRVYIYYKPIEQRNATYNKINHKKDIKKRKKACDEYAYFNPSIGRYAIGYQHSVWELFNNSYSSEFEYIDTLQNLCK